ncbi:type II toxin-antitoxin system HigB family toxin [Rosenbergiella collisarenosi]|uniref:type II toxin-antitoxin system HigB family toxin n=1 Tax=Rosenbergiella collisarenosi TaxID=1544695 RepID=UPI001BDAFF0B|nr:type II toxin-antitoxin system HigB family toxin [Rosenbergiella collisarenosi]MBT0722529.1 type II toxin-antitoxin system HigB family toxin [Rosenbergiella collisarenosi]
MRVVSRVPFREAADEFKQFAKAIEDVYQVLKKGEFTSPDELKKAFPSLDRMKYKERWWVIDVRGGNIRILLKIDLPTQTVYVKHITNHADYDKLIAGFRSTK